MKIALINFVLVACLGALIRYSFYQPIPGVVYTFVLHAHSHLAFLGWVFMALYALLLEAFLPGKAGAWKYTIFFFVFQIANLGMLFTFPFTGYAFWSILFSSIHGVSSIAFAYSFIRDARRPFKSDLSFRFVQWGLIMMIAANLAPFSLGPLMANGMGGSDLYYLIIYAYLHFQYNGWFSFAVIGLLLKFLDSRGIDIHVTPVKWALYLLLGAAVPAYALSTLWTEPDPTWYIISGIAAVVQLIGFILLVKFFFQQRDLIKLPFVPRALMLFGGTAFGVKYFLQLLSALPALSEYASTHRNIVIAYLHLVLIGVITVFLFFFLYTGNYLKKTVWSHLGLYGFLTGFVLTEFVLLFQGQLPANTLMLFGLAGLQLLSLFILVLSTEDSKKLAF